jgi:hypothetical protein
MSANPYPQPGAPGYLNPAMVTTALELPGYRIVRNLGVVRGIVVRSGRACRPFSAATSPS